MPGPEHKTKVLCEDETCLYNVDSMCSCGTITIDYGNCCESYEENDDEE